MVRWQEFTLELVQAAILLRGQEFSAARAVATILPRYSERFDGDMQVLPLPADAPPEIPRVVLQSGDGRWRLSMGPTRIDSVWNNKPGTARADLGEMTQECSEVLQRYIGEKHLPVDRLALVIQRVCPVENPAQVLVHRFCNEASENGPFRRSETFEIHNHKAYTPSHEGRQWHVNSWVRCKTAKLTSDNRPVILVEQDLNTVGNESEPPRFDGAAVQNFFSMAVAEANKVLRQDYFPE
jgi:hypothetical protein